MVAVVCAGRCVGLWAGSLGMKGPAQPGVPQHPIRLHLEPPRGNHNTVLIMWKRFQGNLCKMVFLRTISLEKQSPIHSF